MKRTVGTVLGGRTPKWSFSTVRRIGTVVVRLVEAGGMYTPWFVARMRTAVHVLGSGAGFSSEIGSLREEKWRSEGLWDVRSIWTGYYQK